MEKSSRIKTFAYMSLDGYIAQGDNSAGRMLECIGIDREGYGLREFKDSVGAVVISGIYYASLQGADVWPFGDKMCYIIAPHSFSPAPGFRAEVIVPVQDNDGECIEAVQTLRVKADGDIWLAGDPNFISLFMHRGLVQEITLNILPLTLGQGVPMFGQHQQAKCWKLLCHDCCDGGVIRARYTAAGSAALTQ